MSGNADRPIREEWKAFRRELVPANAPRAQVVETRRAFYAGAGAAVAVMVEGVSDDPETTQADLNLMDQLRDDIVSTAKSFGTPKEAEEIGEEGAS